MSEPRRADLLLGPFKGNGLGVVGGDRLPQLLHTGEAGTAQSVPHQETEPDLHLV